MIRSKVSSILPAFVFSFFIVYLLALVVIPVTFAANDAVATKPASTRGAILVSAEDDVTTKETVVAAAKPLDFYMLHINDVPSGVSPQQLLSEAAGASPKYKPAFRTIINGVLIGQTERVPFEGESGGFQYNISPFIYSGKNTLTLEWNELPFPLWSGETAIANFSQRSFFMGDWLEPSATSSSAVRSKYSLKVSLPVTLADMRNANSLSGKNSLSCTFEVKGGRDNSYLLDKAKVLNDTIDTFTDEVSKMRNFARMLHDDLLRGNYAAVIALSTVLMDSYTLGGGEPELFKAFLRENFKNGFAYERGCIPTVMADPNAPKISGLTPRLMAALLDKQYTLVSNLQQVQKGQQLESDASQWLNSQAKEQTGSAVGYPAGNQVNNSPGKTLTGQIAGASSVLLAGAPGDASGNFPHIFKNEQIVLIPNAGGRLWRPCVMKSVADAHALQKKVALLPHADAPYDFDLLSPAGAQDGSPAGFSIPIYIAFLDGKFQIVR